MPVRQLRYDHLVNQTFGPGAWAGDAPTADANSVVGAFSTANYDRFRENFASRLVRLASLYRGHASWSHLLIQVRELGGRKNWQGAFAELAAFDFFTASMELLARVPTLNVSISGSRTLTSQLGNSGPANLDVHFDDFDVFTDVKVLQDNVSAILNAAFRRVSYPSPKPLVVAEYPTDASYEALAHNLQGIAAALNAELNSGAEPSLITVPEVPDLVFRVKWDGGLLIAEGGYSPYRHAEEAHRLPLLHARKFVLDRPFFLTFVLFPWFNNRVTDFGGSNRIFYRSLSRRIFCQYRHSGMLLSQLLRGYKGAESVFDVSRLLSGLLFLEDTTIDGDEPASPNVKGYWYANPNARHPTVGTMMQDYLRSLPVEEQDEFAYDNY